MNSLKKTVCVLCVFAMLFSFNFTGYATQDSETENEAPSFELVAGKRRPDYITLTLVVKNCVGLEASSSRITFPGDVLSYRAETRGADGAILWDMYKKTDHYLFQYSCWTSTRNGNGEVLAEFAFENKLLSSAEYSLLFASYNDSRTVDSENFRAMELDFYIKDNDAKDITLNVKTEYKLKNGGYKTVEDTFEITVNDHDHILPDEWTIAIPADCIFPGLKIKKCKICGNAIREEIPATPCQYGDWELKRKPTAATDGFLGRTCSGCGSTFGDSIRLYDYSYGGNWKVDLQNEMLIAGVGTTAEELLKSVYEDAAVIDKDGKKVEKDTPVAGGMKVEFYFRNEKMAEIPVVVKGDVDGDSAITAADARLTLRASVGLEELTDWQFNAANVEKETDIDAGAARCILRASVGLDNPDEWIHGFLPLY